MTEAKEVFYDIQEVRRIQRLHLHADVLSQKQPSLIRKHIRKHELLVCLHIFIFLEIVDVIHFENSEVLLSIFTNYSN